MSVLKVQRDFPDAKPLVARRALRAAARELSERGLIIASKWALELLSAVPRTNSSDPSETRSPALGLHWSSSTPARKQPTGQRSGFPIHSTPMLASGAAFGSVEPDTPARRNNVPFPRSPLANASVDGSSSQIEADISTTSMEPGFGSQHVHWDLGAGGPMGSEAGPSSWDGNLSYQRGALDEEEEDMYALAKAQFDHHQLERCAWILDQGNCRSDKSLFLKLYARFLVSERRMNEQNSLIPKQNGKLPRASPDLVALLKELKKPRDPFLLYLKGVIFLKLHKRIEAMDCFITSVKMFPYNWSAWKELSATLDGTSELEELGPLLPQSFMTAFFCEYAVRQQNEEDTENVDRIDALLRLFPSSVYLLTAKAQTLYLNKDMDEAEELFEKALEIDPLRLEGIDDYSNVLYVLDRPEKLAHLAHRFVEVGRDRPEVCCVIGNYYSNRHDHHRAIESFKRALRLDMGCLSAWTLLGHEYLEMKNSHAAAEMYRRAVEINSKDYRAWYGLGQVYELQSSWLYALHYFQKAAAIRPYDVRMWGALASCYEKMGRREDAISCLKRSLDCGPDQWMTVDLIQRIIDTYEQNGDPSAAISWHRRMVQTIDHSLAGPDPIPVSSHVRSYVVAAKWEMGELGAVSEGEEADERVTGAERREEAMDTDAENIRRDKTKAVGNLALANDYLQKAVAAATDETEEAERLLKRLAFLRE